jgi:hypothetical protein
MNATRLIEIAMNGRLETAELNAASATLGMSLPDLCDRLSKEIAEGYLQGDISGMTGMWR